jgi:hypothetical protein
VICDINIEQIGKLQMFAKQSHLWQVKGTGAVLLILTRSPG